LSNKPQRYRRLLPPWESVTGLGWDWSIREETLGEKSCRSHLWVCTCLSLAERKGQEQEQQTDLGVLGDHGPLSSGKVREEVQKQIVRWHI
jgi:hypothetical protein